MISVSKPYIGQRELELVNDAVMSGWISSSGKYISEFENKFASFCGVNNCIATSNGTVAIHLALLALNIGIGDEVIIPDLTFVATANAVKTAGAVPVFADINESDWCLCIEDVKRKITPNTKAIITVHLYGTVGDMDGLRNLANENGLYLIEDAAEAHGAMYKGRSVGSIGDLATFSFFGNKIITTGEGGAITTNSEKLTERIRFLQNHGMSIEKRYWHPEVGYNYRITNLQAAIGVAQLERIDLFIEDRDRILHTYKKLLDLPGYKFNPEVNNVKSVNWMTCVLVENLNRFERDSVLVKLKEKGVEARPFFYPLSYFPMYERVSCKISEKISECGFNLPTYYDLSDSHIIEIVEKFKESILEVKAKHNQ